MRQALWLKKAQDIEQSIGQVPVKNISFGLLEESGLRKVKIEKIVEDNCLTLEPSVQQRIHQEFFGFGPIESLMQDENVNEVMILNSQEIWVERNGTTAKHLDSFASEATFQSFIDLLCQRAHIHFNLENPAANGKIGNFRVHIVSSEITQTSTNITLRRHPNNPWTFTELAKQNWATSQDIAFIKDLVLAKSNLLVVGATGSGKTSLLNAFMQALPENERLIILEDTSELTCPNLISTKLISRFDANGILKPIDLGELTRQALRMRPDRLVMGEVRGPEAKDLLLALSTGHEGSFASLHAASAKQALIRLEMLIQLGAPEWSLWAIRNLICLSLNHIIVVKKNSVSNSRELDGIYQLKSLEETGILLEKVF